MPRVSLFPVAVANAIADIALVVALWLAKDPTINPLPPVGLVGHVCSFGKFLFS